MPTAKEGQIVQGPDGTFVVQNGKLVPVSGGPTRPAPKMTNPDRTVLNDLNKEAREAREIQEQYRAAEGAIKRLKPGPWRAAFLDAALPEENGGVLDRLGSLAIGGPARMLGAISGQDVNDFQRLKGLQSQRVLSEQIAQKGPQTESDAARMQMTEISPYKSVAANNAVVRSGTAKTARVQSRATFYTQWANKYGLNGVDERGRSVQQAWEAGNAMAKPGGGPRIKRIR